jgi:hypothetical protein
VAICVGLFKSLNRQFAKCRYASSSIGRAADSKSAG